MFSYSYFFSKTLCLWVNKPRILSLVNMFNPLYKILTWFVKCMH